MATLKIVEFAAIGDRGDYAAQVLLEPYLAVQTIDGTAAAGATNPLNANTRFIEMTASGGAVCYRIAPTGATPGDVVSTASAVLGEDQTVHRAIPANGGTLKVYAINAV